MNGIVAGKLHDGDARSKSKDGVKGGDPTYVPSWSDKAMAALATINLEFNKVHGRRGGVRGGHGDTDLGWFGRAAYSVLSVAGIVGPELMVLGFKALFKGALKKGAALLGKAEAEALGAREVLGGAGVAAATTKRAPSPLMATEGEVARFDDLPGVVGDNLTGHHVPSKNHMAKHGVAAEDGVAFNMEHPHPRSGGRHRDTFTYGTQADINMSSRDALAAGVRDLRRIYARDGLYGPYIRQQLQTLIEMNKPLFPRLFRR